MNRKQKIRMLKRIDHCDGPWWLWECEVEYEDGTVRTGSVTGDGHNCAPESLELDPMPAAPKRKGWFSRWTDQIWERHFAAWWSKQ